MENREHTNWLLVALERQRIAQEKLFNVGKDSQEHRDMCFMRVLSGDTIESLQEDVINWLTKGE